MLINPRPCRRSAIQGNGAITCGLNITVVIVNPCRSVTRTDERNVAISRSDIDLVGCSQLQANRTVSYTRNIDVAITGRNDLGGVVANSQPRYI